MLVKAKIGFAGAVSMAKGSVREIPESKVLRDLLRVGYVEEAEKKTPKKAVKKGENK